MNGFLGFVLLLALVPACAGAQEKDSLATMAKFVSVCNGYKQPPMHLGLSYTTACNYMPGPDDSSRVRAEFYSVANGAYIKFGELEELVNDSMALLVSQNLQRMVLYANARPVVEKMKAMMGMDMPKASLQNMCRQYEVYKKQKEGSIEAIELQSRQKVPHTNLPKEGIELRYNAGTQFPTQVVETKRSLFPITQLQYDSLGSQPGWAGKRLALDGSFYLVREWYLTYGYENMEHGDKIKVPIGFADRIVKGTNGAYAPVAAYSGYLLSEQ